jgi:type II secretory pathway pseudopilin PulG
LAAIALPNFLEAQARAKVSRTAADLRTLATAIESYRVDRNQYPPENHHLGSPLHETNAMFGEALPNRIKLAPLTTPVAYITSLPSDPFGEVEDPLNMLPPPVYHYASRNDPAYPGAAFWDGDNEEHIYSQWIVQGNGPDRTPLEPNWQFPRYDPTNGTVSLGNVLRFGP